MAQGVDNNAAAVGRSAESKSADSGATEVCLKAYGAIVREAIDKVYALIVEGRGDNVRITVEGLDRFNLADAAIVVENTATAKELCIPSKTLQKALFQQAAESLLPSLDQVQKDAIRVEIEAGVEEMAQEAAIAKKRLAEVPPPPASKPGEPPAQTQPPPN